jgi:HD superfamily phosphohydrolase YqeK
VKDFEEKTFADLKNHPAFEILTKPIDDTHESVSDKKLHHIANVSSTMGRIALLHPKLGLDPDLAWLAGSIHDLFDRSFFFEITARPKAEGQILEWFWVTGHDHHGALAAARAAAQQWLSPKWIDAIRHHSTRHPCHESAHESNASCRQH